MKFGETIIFRALVIGVLIIQCPQHSEAVTPNQPDFNTKALKDVTVHKKTESFVSRVYNAAANKIIVKALFLFIKKEQAKLAAKEPVTYEFREPFDIKESDFEGTGYFQNVTLPDSSKFIVKHLASRVEKKQLEFKMFLKKFTAKDINYELEGNIFIFSIKGHGKIHTITTNLTINGTIDYHFINGTVQIIKMDLHYIFEKFEMSITGIQVPFLSNTQLNKLLSQEGTNYLRKNEGKICAKASKKVIKIINKRLETLTLRNFLKNLWDKLCSL